MTPPRLTSVVADLPATVPFVGPEAAERASGRPFAARLGANESVFGPSPEAVRAIREAAPEAWMYGDPESFELRRALAASLGVAMDEIVVGAGIDGLLGSLVRLHAGPGDVVVTSDGAYPTFNYHVAGYGAALVRVPFRDDREDPGALLSAARDGDAKIVYIANPDNPMGSWHDRATMESMIEALPGDTLLALDEAYVEFAPEGTAPAIDTSRRNVVRFRTFSKAHGLAGMRVGYAFGHRDTIRAFEKVRNHFGMSRVSQKAALAALGDAAWLTHVQGEVARSRDRIAEIARGAGLEPLPSATNFVAIDCGRDAAFAKRVLDGLVARGIFVRMPFAEPGNRCIRVSCGRPADLDLFAAALPEALAGARAGG